MVFEHISVWFKVNLLSLNFDKTHCIQFITKDNSFVGLNLDYDDKQIAHISNTKFLEIVIDNSLSWKLHIEHIIPKLNAAWYAVKSVKSYMYITSNAVNGLLCLLLYHYDLQINILGQIFI